MNFRAPAGLNGPHRQTVLGSRARKLRVDGTARAFRAAAQSVRLVSSDGATLEARVNSQRSGAPLAILIHGWLGSADSSYVVSAAEALWRAGYCTARLNLRDHGPTAALNEELFHSGRLREAADACEQLASRSRAGAGLVGFSLGGNFALRIARQLSLRALAICPVIDPSHTARALEAAAPVYAWWFLRKWRRAMRAKARAFPERYDFREAYALKRISALTDYFVHHHTEFASTEEYYASYRIAPADLAGTATRIIYAADDPVIPAASVDVLAGTTDVTRTHTGGHCGFINSWSMTSWIDGEICRHFLGAEPRAPSA